MPTPEIRGYLPAVRRWWPTLVASALVAGALAAALTTALPQLYEARTQLLVGPVNADADAQRTAGTLARTYAELAVSESALLEAIDALGLRETPEDLREERLQVSGSTQTRFVVIVVEQEDPQLAAALANFLADHLIELASDGSADSQAGRITVIDPAEPPTEPSGPRTSVLALAAAMAGGVVALMFAVAAEYFSDRVGDPEQLAALAKSPFLGTVDLRRSRPRDVAARDAALHRLASVILLATKGAPQAVAIVPVDGAETTALAAEVARVMGAFGKRAIVITDGPVQHQAVDGGAAPVVEIDAAGQPPGDKARARSIIDKAKLDADVAIIAAGPLATSSQTLIWASVAGSTILAAQNRALPRAAARSAVDALNAVGARVHGVVTVSAPVARRNLRRAHAAKSRQVA